MGQEKLDSVNFCYHF